MSSAIVRRVGQTVAFVVVVGDIGAGLGWTLGSPNRTGRVLSYDVARQIMPIRSWGIVLVTLAVIAALEALVPDERQRVVRPAWAILCGYWTFWLVMFTAAAFRGGGLAGPWNTLTIIAAHVVPLLSPILRRERAELEALASLHEPPSV